MSPEYSGSLEQRLFILHSWTDSLEVNFEKIQEDGLSMEWVPSGSEIRFCYTLINRKQHTITEIVEEGEPVSKETEKA